MKRAPAFLFFFLALSLPSWASLTFNSSPITGTNGAGDNLSASVIMFLPGDSDSYGHTCTGGTGTLCMTLINTQSGGTQTRGDVLAALYFSVAGNPVLTPVSALADTVLRPNSTSTPVLSVAPQSPVLNGGWALATNPGVDTVNASLPTTGYVWTTVGNSGAVSNGTYNVGTDNYAIISGTNVSVIGGGIPVISNEVFLTLSGFQSGGQTLALTSISNVIFTWNSTGQFSSNGTLATPEPSALGLIGLGLLGFSYFARRMQRRQTLREREGIMKLHHDAGILPRPGLR